MDSRVRKVIWLYSLAAFGLVMGTLGPLNAAIDVSAKHAARKKHPHKTALIVLSNDDLPRNGRHYIMVPGAPPPALIESRPALASSAPSPTAAPSTPTTAAAGAVPATGQVPNK